MSVSSNYILATKVRLTGEGWPKGDTLPVLPLDGFTGTSHHNIASPTGGFKVGQVVRYYDHTRKAYISMAYVQFGTASGVAYAAGSILSIADATDNASLYDWRLNNDPDEMRIKGGRGALCLSAVTAEYYGWVHVEGPPPGDNTGRAECALLAAASVDCYWDVASVAGACHAIIGKDGGGIDELQMLVPDGYDQFIFAELNGVATAK